MANVLVNPSFETDTSDWSLGTANTTFTRVVGTSQDGVAYAEMACTGSTSTNRFVLPGNIYSASPGQVWSAGAYFKQGTGTTRQIRLDIQFLDSGNNPIAPQAIGTAVNLTGSWAQVKNENATAPANTTKVRIRVAYLAASTGDSVLMDAMQLELGSTLPAYNPVTPTAVAVSDTLSASVTDTSALTGLIGVTDALSAALTDASSIAVAIGTADSLQASLSDDRTIQVALSPTDTLAASLADASTNTLTLTRTDTLSASLDESTGLAVVLSTADSAVIALTDASQLDVALSVTDSLVAALDDASSLDTGETGNVFVWNGTDWLPATVVVWNGTDWEPATLHKWNGTDWI